MTRHDEPAEGDVAGVAEVLAAHRGIAFTGDEIRCPCDGAWRPMAAWEAHVADALRDLLAATWEQGCRYGYTYADDPTGGRANPYRATERAQ